MNRFIQIRTTCDDEENAKQIAQLLVTRRLVACAQISGPVHSVYRWEDEIQQSREWTIDLKTTWNQKQAIEQLILEHHSYDVPEILITEIAGGSQQYLKWISDEVDESQ